MLRRAAEVEILADDLQSAERALREALEVNAGMEERDPVSQIAAVLSRILTIRGNTGEAARFAKLSKDHAPSESVAAQALWRSALARVLASRVEPREAEALAREAVELAPAEMLNLRADLAVDLAEILVATGQQDQAQTLLRGAGDLYKRKGNEVGERRAQEFVT
jgi:ATP/maltotriose-dependent transcriptional regulator MalT